MSWLDRFRTKRGAEEAPAGASPARRFSLEREHFFDLPKTQLLCDLLSVEKSRRDAGWSGRFYDTVWHCSLNLASNTPITGPDGYPYARLELPNGAFEAQSLGNLAPALVENGIGAAIFLGPDAPPEAAEFVFSMGALDSIMRFDRPDGDPQDIAERALPGGEDAFEIDGREGVHEMRVRTAHQVMIGAPSRDYLPSHVARALYRHLIEGWGMDDPKVALILDPEMRPHRSLVIGRRRDEFPPGADIDAIVRHLLWYLLPSQMLMLLPEPFDPRNLTSLADYFEPANGA